MAQPQGSEPTSFPPLKTVIASSQRIYARDLRALYEHARDRFGDVRWGDLDQEWMGSSGQGTSANQVTIKQLVESDFEPVESTAATQPLKAQEQDDVWAHKAIIYVRASSE